ncbi:obscurihypothetical protein [Limosa lapponica baueri]|uniref:Uncharacterized protein n=1 Tax=Limosa lapponica baueri TaxID=1758121 RepID=A0A2I0TZ11_LIMLA|nr:obscurihypothetical protein [Limosa lapponica baueri]PKU41189.1 obscurihypothetical protein [Limosa lapponica baueri]
MDLELHQLTVTTAKAALELHVPHQPLLIGQDKIRNGTSPCLFLYHLKKEVIINVLQEPAGLLMPCCAVPPTDTKLVEVAHEDQDL